MNLEIMRVPRVSRAALEQQAADNEANFLRLPVAIKGHAVDYTIVRISNWPNYRRPS